MSFLWQNMVVLAVVGASAVYLVRHVRRTLSVDRSSRACGGGCAGCSSGAKPAENHLVSLTTGSQEHRLSP